MLLMPVMLVTHKILLVIVYKIYRYLIKRGWYFGELMVRFWGFGLVIFARAKISWRSRFACRRQSLNGRMSITAQQVA
jgi:hypothetical protein